MDRQREVRLHPAEELLVPGERQVRVEAALQQDLHAAEVDGLLELLGQLVARQDVALGLVGGRAVEVAELAARDADVRVVDVAIDDVGDDVVGVEHPAARVGGGAQLQHRRLGVDAHRRPRARGARRRRRREERVDRAARAPASRRARWTRRPWPARRGAGARARSTRPAAWARDEERRHAGELLGRPAGSGCSPRGTTRRAAGIAAVRFGVGTRDERTGAEPVRRGSSGGSATASASTAPGRPAQTA